MLRETTEAERHRLEVAAVSEERHLQAAAAAARERLNQAAAWATRTFSDRRCHGA